MKAKKVFMSLKQQLLTHIISVLEEMGIGDNVPIVAYPADSSHGDYATNVAMVIFKKYTQKHQDCKTPMDLAEKIAKELQTKNQELKLLEKVEVVRPGFINFWMNNDLLMKHLSLLDSQPSIDTSLTGEKIMVEFAHPNTHKAFHIGHLRNITTGESIVRLLEVAGVNVIRANYQGDVGMHIAKTIHGLTMLIGQGKRNTTAKREDFSDEGEWVLRVIKDLDAKDSKERIAFLGEAYAYGSTLYEENKLDTVAIKEINSSIYKDDWGIYKPYKEVYQITRQWSLDYLNHIYKRVDTHFDRLYFESEVYEKGKDIVKQGKEKGIFTESAGAIIFPGESFGLHNRVFITSEGNPTYEGKEVGLAPLQFKEYNPDRIIHIVGPEQAGYFQVVFEALGQLFPQTRGKEYHLIYGWVKLKHGKMSSRTGSVVLGEWLIDGVKNKIHEEYHIPEDIGEQVAIAAIKYSFLKVSLNQEISFDINESISLAGNSGPYLQYTYVRTQSVLKKIGDREVEMKNLSENTYQMQPEERELLRLLSRFSEVVSEAAERFAPNIVCTYLFELAQSFNLFYQKYPILKEADATRNFRLALTAATGNVIQQGLSLLGIKSPEHM
jgi:arginyl-tRNA synthetase